MGWVQEKTGSNAWASESGHSSEWLKEGSPEKSTVTAREYAQQASDSAFFAGQAKEEATAARDVVLASKMAVEAARVQAVQASEAADSSSAEAGRTAEEVKAVLEEAVAIVPSVRVEAIENGVRVTAKDSAGETVAEVLNGKDGYSPVRGVDYFTAADVEAMVDAVAARFADGDKEAY